MLAYILWLFTTIKVITIYKDITFWTAQILYVFILLILGCSYIYLHHARKNNSVVIYHAYNMHTSIQFQQIACPINKDLDGIPVISSSIENINDERMWWIQILLLLIMC